MNSRLQNPITNSRIRNEYPNSRTSAFQIGILTAAVTSNFIAGMPIGLLLSLTYATNFTETSSPEFRSDFRPNIRIN